jgi:hypothetical protein
LIAKIRPDHEEGSMGKIEDAQDTKDEAHPRGKQKEACGVSEAIQKKIDKNTGFQEFSISKCMTQGIELKWGSSIRRRGTFR